MGQQSRLAMVLVVLAVLLAGCAGLGGDAADGGSDDMSNLAAGDGGDGGGSGAEADGGDSADAAEQRGDSGPPAGDGGDTGQQAQSGDATIQRLATDRSIIQTGSVRVQVDDFETERGRLQREVSRLGGYVGSSNVDLNRRDNQTWRTGSVTLRVPAESFSRMLSYAKDRGEVRSEETSTTDVTDQLVELDARIANLEEKRARLRAFYEDAESTDALLRIEDRLSDVQGEIEQLQAKKRSLEDRVTYATLTVELREPAPDATDPDPGVDGDRAGLLGALLESVDSLVGIVYGGLLVAAAAVPWLLALLLALGVLAVLRRMLGQRALRAAVPWTSTSTPMAGPAAPVDSEPAQADRGRQGDARDAGSDHDRGQESPPTGRDPGESGEAGAGSADTSDEGIGSGDPGDRSGPADR